MCDRRRVLTFTALALAAAGALGFWIRRRMKRSAERKQKEGDRARAAKIRAEQDRLDCLELERSLSAGPPSARRP